MINWISKVLLSALAVFFLSWLLPGVDINESYQNAFLVALVLSLLNAFLKPVLVILTLPATILSLGLFMLVINAGIILLADKMLDGFVVNNFWWALLFSALLSIVNSILNRLVLQDNTKPSKSFFVRRNTFSNEAEQTTTTVTGKKIKVEDGKKTIIIEKD